MIRSKKCFSCGGKKFQLGAINVPSISDLMQVRPNDLPNLDPYLQMPSQSLNYSQSEIPTLSQEQPYRRLNRTEQMIDMGLLEAPKGYTSAKEWYESMGSNQPEKKKKKDLMDYGLLLRGIRTGLGAVGAGVERRRQDRYMYDQFSTLGQMNPMPANDYQPNPYSLYARYGGSLKKYLKGGYLVENQKFTNEAKMRMDKYRELK